MNMDYTKLITDLMGITHDGCPCLLRMLRNQAAHCSYKKVLKI